MRSALLAACLAGCVTTTPVVEPKLPDPIPERAEQPFTVQFLQDRPPQAGELFVCGLLKDGTFSCVDFQKFMSALDAAPREDDVVFNP